MHDPSNATESDPQLSCLEGLDLPMASLLRGHLLKKSGTELVGWQKRWVVINAMEIEVMRTEKGPVRTSIPFSEVEWVRSDDDIHKGAGGFRIFQKRPGFSRVYEFAAVSAHADGDDDEPDVKAWVRAVKGGCVAAKGYLVDDTPDPSGDPVRRSSIVSKANVLGVLRRKSVTLCEDYAIGGDLHKKGSFGRWKQRYFVVRKNPPVLKWAQSFFSHSRGEVSLCVCVCVSCSMSFTCIADPAMADAQYKGEINLVGCEILDYADEGAARGYLHPHAICVRAPPKGSKGKGRKYVFGAESEEEKLKWLGLLRKTAGNAVIMNATEALRAARDERSSLLEAAHAPTPPVHTRTLNRRSSAKGDVTFKYLNCRGSGEAIRLMLVDAGIQWRDQRLPLSPSERPDGSDALPSFHVGGALK